MNLDELKKMKKDELIDYIIENVNNETLTETNQDEFYLKALNDILDNKDVDRTHQVYKAKLKHELEALTYFYKEKEQEFLNCELKIEKVQLVKTIDAYANNQNIVRLTDNYLINFDETKLYEMFKQYTIKNYLKNYLKL